MAEFLKIAKLNEQDVAKIRALEEAMGTHIMAYQPGLQMADLTAEQVQALQGVENELGVILLAYDE
ncbi:MAG: hypothetical protein R6X34_12870 [Chloroflexota bacterium]